MAARRGKGKHDALVLHSLDPLLPLAQDALRPPPLRLGLFALVCRPLHGIVACGRTRRPYAARVGVPQRERTERDPPGGDCPKLCPPAEQYEGALVRIASSGQRGPLLCSSAKEVRFGKNVTLVALLFASKCPRMNLARLDRNYMPDASLTALSVRSKTL